VFRSDRFIEPYLVSILHYLASLPTLFFVFPCVVKEGRVAVLTCTLAFHHTSSTVLALTVTMRSRKTKRRKWQKRPRDLSLSPALPLRQGRIVRLLAPLRLSQHRLDLEPHIVIAATLVGTEGMVLLVTIQLGGDIANFRLHPPPALPPPPALRLRPVLLLTIDPVTKSILVWRRTAPWTKRCTAWVTIKA